MLNYYLRPGHFIWGQCNGGLYFSITDVLNLAFYHQLYGLQNHHSVPCHQLNKRQQIVLRLSQTELEKLDQQRLKINIEIGFMKKKHGKFKT